MSREALDVAVMRSYGITGAAVAPGQAPDTVDACRRPRQECVSPSCSAPLKFVARRHLVISPKTANNHIEHIYAKLGVNNRGRASLFAVQHGLIDDPSNMM